MRIAVVHSFYSSRAPSGENNVVDAQVEVLRGAGHEVRLLSQSTDARLRRRSYPVEAAATVASGVGPSPLREIEEFAPDVVHLHNLFPNYGRRWVRRLDVPLVATLHNYRPLCPRGTLYRAGAGCTLCPDAGSGRPGVRHGCFHDSALATVPSALGTRFADDPVLRRANVLTTLSPGMSEVYEKYGVPRDKLMVVENFVEPGIPGPGGEAWLYAGRLDREKGVHALVAQWPRGQRLLIAGEEDPGDPLPAHPDVRLLGRLDRSRLRELASGCRGLVFPSILPEALALVCLEALSVGTPVLTFDDIPAGEAVSRLGVGLAGPRAELATLLVRAAAEFPGLRARCLEAYERHYTSAAWLSRIESAYRGAADRHPPPATG